MPLQKFILNYTILSVFSPMAEIKNLLSGKLPIRTYRIEDFLIYPI